MVRVINLSFYPPGAVAVTNRPHIYYCRSPNMEVFTCWWHPLDNNSESDDNITYSLTYSLEKGPRRECPDYVTGGPNSCHFDSGHTSIWTRYCMNVMARTSHGVFSSKDHCLDVADIVETEAPVNLTYTLLNETEEEAGRTAMVSWVYPNPSHIQYGWITLVFELQYRRIAEPNNWKVKGLLREPCLELLDLPVGEYIVRVRCRSRNNGLWSKWSTPVLLCVPVKSTPGAVAVTNRPHIYYCRSPNMEVFTCWWHPLDNNSESDDNVTYSLTYSLEKGPRRECPDYVTGGPNSCHFDSGHTSIWTIYCMNVMARTSHGVFSSKDHCLDVADIVETEAPVNLTYTLLNETEEEAGRTAMVSWVYPNPSHIQYGWITLVFELQYRRIAEPNNWKVKGLLREPWLELLDLPVGEYIVRVRCRSRNNGLWSKWSTPVLLCVPVKSTSDKLLALLLVTGVGVMLLLVIGFGIILQGKRIKAFLLPPIPKPRIRGINPLLLKKGGFDEINRHFISFHGYKPPSYSEEEVWDSVSMDNNQSLQAPLGILAVRKEDYDMAIHSQLLVQTTSSHAPYTPVPASYNPVPAHYCQAPVEAFPTPWEWPTANPDQSELLVFPGTDYSMMVDPNPVPPPDQQAPPPSSTQGFYTCVNMLGDNGQVHLVPCLPNHLKHSPYVQLEEELDEGGLEKSSQLDDYLAKKMEAVANGSAPGETVVETEVETESVEQSEVAVPLLPGTTGTQGNMV
ncbi:prolactin receptor-like [Oncorhynchus tshawytscha]|uniref:prolactin receptor-like n=1 Tax=Oncorhynchus tshawytscha TaxID=74940 RepID=UPI001C3CD56F|nr:prolactin receptor-like [Oncorhynchus tshawytscha]